MKKIFAIVMTAAMVMATMVACGAQTEQQTTTDTKQTTANDQQAADVADEGSEAEVGMVNPWKSISEEDSHTYVAHAIVIPEGATNVEWTVNDSMEDGALVQVEFSLDDMVYTVRAKAGQIENMDTDLAGAYYEWTFTEDTNLSGWGDAATTYLYSDDTQAINVIAWYDTGSDVSYSIFTSAVSLDGFDIKAIAEQIH